MLPSIIKQKICVAYLLYWTLFVYVIWFIN